MQKCANLYFSTLVQILNSDCSLTEVVYDDVHLQKIDE